MSVPKLKWGIRATSEMKNALIRAVKALPATACRVLCQALLPTLSHTFAAI